MKQNLLVSIKELSCIIGVISLFLEENWEIMVVKSLGDELGITTCVGVRLVKYSTCNRSSQVRPHHEEAKHQ